jgi:hypothetical protein
MRGVVIATHAQRFRPDQADLAPRARITRRARDATAGLTVVRLARIGAALAEGAAQLVSYPRPADGRRSDCRSGHRAPHVPMLLW